MLNKASPSVSDVVSAVRAVVGPGKIRLHDPSIGEAEHQSVSDIIRNDPVGYSAIDKMQAKIAQVCGVEQSLMTSSGTSALHLALLALGVEPFTEVLVPTLTFVGTANAVSHCGAIVNFVDSRMFDLGINPFKLGRYLARICEKREKGTFNRQSGRRISALIAVDLLGVPCDMDAINAECVRWGIPVIEDAAQALGSTYKGKPCGSSGSVGIISFNNNKIVTTNGGGALLTNDPWIIGKAWELGTTARIAHPYRMEHSAVAYNYRMGNINAAFGLPQVERLERLVAQKTKLHLAYRERLEVQIDGELPESSRSNYWLNALVLGPVDQRRDEILAGLHGEGIACRTLFTPIHDLPMYKGNPRDNLEDAQHVWRRIVCLPSSPALAEAL